MSHHEIKDMPASVRARLLNKSRSQNRPFNEMLQYYAIERFLHRLANSSHCDNFLLKGALMLRAIGAAMSRPTMDIDLLGKRSNKHEHLLATIQDCIAIETHDGISFDTESIAIQDIMEDADYHGIRITFKAFLGTARIPMQVDIGFGDKVTPGPIWIDYPEILDFGRPRLLACPPETAIAEKLHAMVNLDTINSRMKDFYDIYLMREHLEFKGSVLVEAVIATFANRGTDIPSDTVLSLSPAFLQVPGKQAQWDAFIKRLRIEDSPPFEDILKALADFLIPVLKHASTQSSFNSVWCKGGPWSNVKTDKSK